MANSLLRLLKSRRSIDPQQPGFGFAGIAPAVRRGALEIETVARLHAVVLVGVEPDFKFAAENMKKFLAFVSVGFAAVAAGLDAEKMRLHGGVAPGEQFHAHALGSLQDFAFARADQAGIVLGGFKEGKDVGAVVAGDAAHGGDGGAHLAAFEGAEKTDGDAGGASDLGKRKTATLTQATKTQAGRGGVLGGG